MSCVTVFGGTGFLGRRVVRHLRQTGDTVRIVSRHPGPVEDNGVERIVADVHDRRSVEDAVARADGVVNTISLYVEHGRETFWSVHVEAAAQVARAARLKARGMEITATVPEPSKLSSFGASSNRYDDECPLSGVKRTSKCKSVTSAFDPKRTSAR